MDRISQADEVVPGQPQQDAAHGPDDMAVLGGASASAASALHPEGPQTERPSGVVTAANVLRLLEYQHYRCALTGRRLTPGAASLDHIVPVRDGGEHRIENTQALHKDVNRAKSTMSVEEFVRLCREVVRHAARKEPGATQ
jgi:5-methylcytosine-specific restriction endonuclease McrA